MKKIFHGCVSGLALVAATSLPLSAQEMLTELGEGEGSVSIVAWPGYIERGETDPAFDWVTKFEEETGCMVEVKTANTSDEMVALMNEGGFDLVTASVLMAMGMMMVPPAMISLPIKLLLFVLVDGWNLVVGSLARSIMGGG